MNWPHQSDLVRSEFMTIVKNSYQEVWHKDAYVIYRRR